MLLLCASAVVLLLFGGGEPPPPWQNSPLNATASRDTPRSPVAIAPALNLEQVLLLPLQERVTLATTLCQDGSLTISLLDGWLEQAKGPERAALLRHVGHLLYEKEDRQGVVLLERYLREPLSTRLAAAEALAVAGQDSGWNTLLALLTTPEAQEQVLHTLHQITGAPFPPPFRSDYQTRRYVSTWHSWWVEHRGEFRPLPYWKREIREGEILAEALRFPPALQRRQQP
jgi:hypothetical protein